MFNSNQTHSWNSQVNDWIHWDIELLSSVDKLGNEKKHNSLNRFNLESMFIWPWSGQLSTGV